MRKGEDKIKVPKNSVHCNSDSITAGDENN